MRTHKILSCCRKSKRSLICFLTWCYCQPSFARTTPVSNYPCLELTFMVPKEFEPLKFDCIYLREQADFTVTEMLVGWFVGFWHDGPLRQYFNLHRAVSQRRRQKREKIDERKNVQTTPTRTCCKSNNPLPYNFPD